MYVYMNIQDVWIRLLDSGSFLNSMHNETTNRVKNVMVLRGANVTRSLYVLPETKFTSVPVLFVLKKRNLTCYEYLFTQQVEY